MSSSVRGCLTKGNTAEVCKLVKAVVSRVDEHIGTPRLKL